MENWKVISFNENYEVSDNGRIRNAKTKRILPPNRQRAINTHKCFCMVI